MSLLEFKLAMACTMYRCWRLFDQMLIYRGYESSQNGAVNKRGSIGGHACLCAHFRRSQYDDFLPPLSLSLTNFLLLNL